MMKNRSESTFKILECSICGEWGQTRDDLNHYDCKSEGAVGMAAHAILVEKSVWLIREDA